MRKIDLKKLRTVPSAAKANISTLRRQLEMQAPPFVFGKGYLAILAFGGTIQSAYVPSRENIVPVHMNTAFERTMELVERFGITKRITGAILVDKDSRQITNADLILLIQVIKLIPNEKILVTCGTYMLPLIAQALEIHFGRGTSEKIIGVTGSWLPPSQEAQDVDYNVGGAIAAINAFKFAGQKGIVFAHFHGEVFVGKDLRKIDLHPQDINPKFARPLVEVR